MGVGINEIFLGRAAVIEISSERHFKSVLRGLGRLSMVIDFNEILALKWAYFLSKIKFQKFKE